MAAGIVLVRTDHWLGWSKSPTKVIHVSGTWLSHSDHLYVERVFSFQYQILVYCSLVYFTKKKSYNKYHTVNSLQRQCCHFLEHPVVSSSLSTLSVAFWFLLSWLCPLLTSMCLIAKTLIWLYKANILWRIPPPYIINLIS